MSEAKRGAAITEIFKTKGDLKRWSAKRTVGGILALTACEEIVPQRPDVGGGGLGCHRRRTHYGLDV